MQYAFIILLYLGFTAARIRKNSFKDFDPDLELSAPQIINRHGYPSETHSAITEDGYILILHRIPHGRNNTGYPRKPVLLHHGMSLSSMDFILLGPEKGLAYLLADNGYDVWLANNRGNYHSDGHVTLSYDDPKYWDFSWHEIGIYDIPTEIDYILAKVNQSSLFYAGYSLGSTAFFVMASTRPEYGLKVKAMFGLGPVAYSGGMKSPVRLLMKLEKQIQAAAKIVVKGAVKPQEEIFKYYAKRGHSLTKLEMQMFTKVIFCICGYDPVQFNKTLLPLLLTHYPAGFATKEFAHYGQGANSGKFQQYDYGKIGNLKRYGQADPPVYNLSKIETPVALHYGDNDLFASLRDLNQLYEELPKKIGKFLVNSPGFGHFSFITGIDAKTLIYDKILNLMKTFE